jgi:hypothetical protein
MPDDMDVPAPPALPKQEEDGKKYFHMLCEHITRVEGQFVRDESGQYWVIGKGLKVQLKNTPDNHELMGLMISVCDVSMQSFAAKAAIERLQFKAYRNAGKMKLKRFAAMSPDGSRLYVPVENGQVLQISPDLPKYFDFSPNGENPDQVWVEHPREDPIKWPTDHVDIQARFKDFERLCVDTQACTIPAMRWLVAMHLTFLPYVRDLCSTRGILELQGGTQCGKTSGAQRFTLLHCLGEVKGDVSIAAINGEGDQGLLVLDNREQANFNQNLINFCLFLATGEEYGRANPDGTRRTYACSSRPVAAITTIEGAGVKAELQARCVTVQYDKSVHQPESASRARIEREISSLRHEIALAIMRLLARFMQIRGTTPTPIPLPHFEEYFTTLADLLRAYGYITNRPPEWAESIIREWDTELRKFAEEGESEDALEHPIRQVLKESIKSDIPLPAVNKGVGITALGITYQGVPGVLFVTTANDLLTCLHKLRIPNLTLPAAPALGRRLN